MKNRFAIKVQKISIAVFLVLTSFLSLLAQFDKDVVVIKAYAPTISDAFKLNVMPKITDTLNFKPDFEYQVVPSVYKTSFDFKPIRPAKIVGEPLTRLYGNYVKLGFGSDISPLAEVKINNLRSRNFTFGIEARHHSSYGRFSIDDYKYYPNFSDNYIGVYGTKFLSHKSLSAKLNYSGNKVKYYGFYPFLDQVEKTDIPDQMYHKIIASTRMKSERISKKKIQYDLDLGFCHFADTEESKESSLSLKADFRDQVKESLVGFDTRFSMFNRNSIGDSLQHFLVKMNPWVQRKADEWKATLGVNMYSLINPDENSETYFYPNIKFQFALADKFLLTYFGFTGKLENNYFLDVASDNPFVWAGFQTKPTQHKKIIYAGFKANISSKLSFDIKATYDEMKDNLLFVDTLIQENISDNGRSQFQVVYDDMDMFNVCAEVVYQLNEKIDFRLKGNYYTYFTLKHEEEPWYKPDFDISFAAEYNMQNKLVFSADVFVIGTRWAKNFTGINDSYEPVELDAAADINLGVEYRYTRKISGFLKLNNLIAAKYYQWNHYPTQRFHAQIGVTYAF